MSRQRRSKKPKARPVATAALPQVASTHITGDLTHSPKHSLIVVATLLGLCASLYLWTLSFPLAFDDFTYLTDNPVFRHPDSFTYPWKFTELATFPARIGSDPDFAVNFILRPVAYASFYLNHWADEFNPRWYRLINVGIHGGNALLVFALTSLLLRRASSQRPISDGSILFISFTAALLFVAHPLATESVTYIIQRFTSMAALFSLLALWLHFLAFGATSRGRRWSLRIGSVVAMVLAMQTKECSAVIPFLAVLLDWVVLGSRLSAALRRSIPLLICAPIIPGLVLLISAAQNGWSFDWSSSINIVNSRDEPLNHWHYIVTQFTVLVHYLRLHFWPTGLNLDPEWPMYDSLFKGPVLASLSALIILVGAVTWAFRRFRGDVRSAMAFVFTLWFFISISISSGLVPLPDLVAEHRTYLPSIGIFVLVACLLDQIRTAKVAQPILQRATLGLVGLATIGLAWATCSRNEVWRTSESLWKNTVEGSPGKFRTWGNLGTAYSMSGREEEAVKCYKQAIKIEPRFQNGLLNLSNSLLRLGRVDESVATTIQLIKGDQNAANKPFVAYTLALGLYQSGKLDESRRILEELVSKDPTNPDAQQLLGLIHMQKGKTVFALKHLREAARLRKPSPQLLARIHKLESQLTSLYPKLQ